MSVKECAWVFPSVELRLEGHPFIGYYCMLLCLLKIVTKHVHEIIKHILLIISSINKQRRKKQVPKEPEQEQERK